jgi:glycosyltransferase involved in cell wall biosynthesis
VGIIIPAYNAARWIAVCVNSVLAQTDQNWTAVVVDDGSKDNTTEIVERFNDPRIRLVQQENSGVSAARNRGLAELPAADAVLFLDADDWLAPDALTRLIEPLLVFPRAIAATGPCGFVPENAAPGTRPHHIKRPPAGDLFPRLLVQNLFANGGHLLIRREAAECAGAFRPDLTFGEDWEYWARLAAYGRIAAVNGHPLLFVRERYDGAYLRLAPDVESYFACTKAIFENPMIMRRYGRAGALLLQYWAMSENMWVLGRALVRYGRYGAGLSALWLSVKRRPSTKRIALLAIFHLQGAAQLVIQASSARRATPAR